MERVEGEVQLVLCSACAASFPTFVFSSDTDMTTFVLEAASSVEPAFVALGKLDEDELRAGYASGRERFASRMSQLLGAHLFAPSVARWDESPPSKELTFQQFRQVFRPSEPVYFCPKCGGEAEVTVTKSPADFLAEGGSLELIGDLVLA